MVGFGITEGRTKPRDVDCGVRENGFNVGF